MQIVSNPNGCRAESRHLRGGAALAGWIGFGACAHRSPAVAGGSPPPASASSAAALVGALAVAGCDVSEDADIERGRALFQQKCGTCHALAQAGTSAQVGPDLDAAFAQARADGMDNDTIEGVVQTQIETPRFIEEGAQNYDRVYMPAEIVTGQDAEDVATYVASVAGVPGAKPPQLAPPELFAEKCGICHALAAAGTSSATGPDLDQVARRQGRRLHRAADRRPELPDRPGLLRGRDAGRLRARR